MFSDTEEPLQQTILRYAGIVQSLVAFLCMAVFINGLFVSWSICHDSCYWFSTYILAASACGGIIFVTAVQWKAATTSKQNLQLEAIKCILAEGLFLWANIVAGYFHLSRLFVTGLALVVLFFGPLYCAYAAFKHGKATGRISLDDNRRSLSAHSPEETPLLQEEV